MNELHHDFIVNERQCFVKTLCRNGCKCLSQCFVKHERTLYDFIVNVYVNGSSMFTSNMNELYMTSCRNERKCLRQT